ncbi:uncharacterized protein LOC144916434 [Branchiostoma floridae x Branchiostoma belcheri]
MMRFSFRPQMTSAVDTTYTTTTGEDLLSTVQFANDTFWTTDPTLPSTYSSTQESHDGGVISENIIVIGEEGSKYPYKYRNDRGVVVSEDNEIFVSDLDKKRIDVYNMNGTHLRHFPTELPGGNGQKMLPYDVAMDGQGHLWNILRQSSLPKKAQRKTPTHIMMTALMLRMRMRQE